MVCVGAPRDMRKLTLRAKFIIVLIGVSLVPLIFVSTVTLMRFQRVLSADALKLGHEVAATATADIKSFMISQLRVLDNVTILYHPASPVTRDVAERVVENILFKNESFNDISVVNQDGKELVRKNRLLAISPSDLRNVYDSEAFQSVLREGFYIGQLYIVNGRPFFDIGRQIVDTQGVFAGAVFAQIDAEAVTAVVEAISHTAGPGSRVYIVNDMGIVIAYSDISYILEERDLSHLPAVEGIMHTPHSESISASYENELGVRVLGSAHPMTIELLEPNSKGPVLINWFVIVEQPEAVVYTDASAAAWFLVIVLLAAIVLSAGSALYFAGLISRPIELLHTAALEFGKGNLAYRANVTTGGEIGDLARSFNTTAETLAQTVASLKNEEQVTSAERNKLRLVLAGVTNAVIAVDTNRNVILFNKAAEALTGYSMREVLGKPVQGVIKIFSNDSEIIVDQYCPVKSDLEGPVFRKNNLKFLGKGNKEYVVNLVSGRIHEGENINLGCILTFQDVTREFAMEKTKREFVSIAAHQLRTPLTGLSWISEVLLSGTKGVLNVAQKELVEKSVYAVHRMVELVNDLLDVSRIEEGRFGVRPSQQSIYPMLMRVLDALQKEAQIKHITLTSKLQKGLPELSIDANKLEFVFSNIVDNAIKYTPSGGSVIVSAEKRENEVVVSVTDTGIGISESDSDRVFTKFFRSREAVSYFTDGSGLGLYVAKNIVDQHGGKIRFESKKGKGTTFSVSLPLSRSMLSDPMANNAYAQLPQENT